MKLRTKTFNMTNADSGTTKLAADASLARALAFSLPPMSLCPGTPTIVTLFRVTRFRKPWRQFQSNFQLI